MQYILNNFKEHGNKFYDRSVVGTGHRGLLNLQYPVYAYSFPVIALSRARAYFEGKKKPFINHELNAKLIQYESFGNSTVEELWKVLNDCYKNLLYLLTLDKKPLHKNKIFWQKFGKVCYQKIAFHAFCYYFCAPSSVFFASFTWTLGFIPSSYLSSLFNSITWASFFAYPSLFSFNFFFITSKSWSSPSNPSGKVHDFLRIDF